MGQMIRQKWRPRPRLSGQYESVRGVSARRQCRLPSLFRHGRFPRPFGGFFVLRIWLGWVAGGYASMRCDSIRSTDWPIRVFRDRFDRSLFYSYFLRSPLHLFFGLFGLGPSICNSPWGGRDRLAGWI